MTTIPNQLAWDDFRLVKIIAEARGLTGAAAALGVNHSTAFRRLGQLEAALGVKLFDRHRTGYALTTAGEEMCAIAERMDEDINGFARKIAGQDIAPAGELRVTTSDSLLVHMLMPILAAFRDRYPEIRLDLVVGNQALNLSKRDADVAVRATDSPPETLVGRRLATINWAFYGRLEDFPDPQPPDLVTLYGRDWVGLGDDLSGLKVTKFVREHVAPERIAAKLSTVLGLAEAIESGLGVGAIPCLIGDANPKLRRLADPRPEFSAGLWLLTHPDLRRSARVRVFLDFVAAEIGALRSLVEG